MSALPPPAPAGAPPEVDRLVLRWRSALRDDGHLPRYEDVALGSLGAVADHLALARAGEGGGFRFLSAGPGFEGQVGRDLGEAGDGDLEPNYRGALMDAFRRAVASRQPGGGLARCLVDGAVATCDLLALPLRNRWGGDLVLFYLRRRAATHDLVEAIYRSTGDGLLALAAVEAGAEPDFEVVSLNGAAAALFGRPEEELRWRPLSALVPGWGEGGLRDELAGALRDGRPRAFEHEVRRSGGESRHLRVSAAPLGDLVGVALTDITAMKRREDAMRLLFEANPMPLAVYARDSLALRGVNEALVRLTGRPAAELLAGDWPSLFAPEEREALAAEARVPSDAPPERRAWRLGAAGRDAPEVELYAGALAVDGEPCALASLHDVTEQRRAQARIAHMAHHDDLTGLGNRALFHARLGEMLARARGRGETVAVLCLDLDSFKQVNDTLGHGAGDQVLRGAGERIAAAIRPGDVAARLGGDEFAVVAGGLSGPEEAGALARRLIARVAAPYPLDAGQATVGASVGLSLAPADGSTPDVLLGKADVALYRAKAEGRGASRFFEPGLDRDLTERRAFEADLRAALGRGEFELYFQPIVDAASPEILGFEALLRWFHPERGAVGPAEFIPVAEEIGAIDAIGGWVLREACAEAARWPGERRVAVNLSAAQFRRGGLPELVAATLAASGLEPARLELEITESVFLDDSAGNLDTLRRLRALGVSVSLDDFGTGYSSLAYLSRFPFSKIKIDRSFVRDMAADRHGLAIVRAVVSLGSSLGLRTVAEGVETAEQAARLRQEGCTELQGFLFGRPMPAPRLAALMSAGGAARARDAA